MQSEDNRPLNAEKAQVERSFESQTVEREGGEKYKLGQRVWGAVLRLTETQAVIALGEEGLDEGTLDLVHLRDEFGNLDLSEGDQVQAFIIELEPAIKLAPSLLPPASEVMRRLQEAFSRGDNVRGRVMAINRGGLEIDVDGRRAFCPYSQIEIGRSEHPEIYINHILDFRVMELDEEKRRVVLSRRAVLEEERREALGELRSQIKEGADVDGVVTRLQPFGAFVDIGGGIEGLVHVSEISHDRIDHPSAVLQPGEKARVRVLSIARDPQGHERIKLSIKALLEDPWLQIDKLFHSGDIITGTVVRITEFGAFVKVHPGIEGLLHVSQYKPSSSTGEDESENAAEPGAPAGDAAPFVGQEIVVRIARIEPQRRRISLNLREPERTERPEFEASVGEVLEGVVRAIRPFGVFVDLPSLGEYASGLLPAAETGLPRGVNLKRKYNPGDKLRVEIVEIDERGRVRLSQRSVREREERGEGAASGRGLTTSPPGGFNVFAEAFRKAQEKKERGDAR